jgi:hypothetical protein
MRRTALVFLALFLAVLFCRLAWSDTGTYEILKYEVKLTPRSDGTVEISYYYRWKVTGGHIPWITVGTANSHFNIINSSGNVKGIRNASESDWSGVRVDLDKDYKPGESFEVFFTLSQNRLFYATKEEYRLDFTPGWYNNCITDTLVVSVICFVKMETVKTNPKPSSILGQEIKWVKRLDKGERFSISVSFPKTTFPKISKSNVRHGLSTGATIVIIVVLLILAVIIIGAAISYHYTNTSRESEDDSNRYSGGRIQYGGIGSSPGERSRPCVGGGGSGGGGRRSGSGGGGFGGSVISCACACVSCACACACAGGGGAGCDRKNYARKCVLQKTQRNHIPDFFEEVKSLGKKIKTAFTGFIDSSPWS